jgi:8-oxo-dGTP pyrophosphatase MutT (NUDIX family)
MSEIKTEVIIYKAGAVILSRKNPSLVALLYRSKQNDWSFPKGHIEDGESEIDAAKREIMEETGLSVDLINDDLPPVDYVNLGGKHIIIHMFMARSADDATLKTEFDGDEIIWMPYEKVINKLTYDNMKRYYRGILSQVENTIKTCPK